MSSFDSPIGRCESVRELVLTDGTQADCAGEHGCAEGCECPLQAWFPEPAPALATRTRHAASRARH